MKIQEMVNWRVVLPLLFVLVATPLTIFFFWQKSSPYKLMGRLSPHSLVVAHAQVYVDGKQAGVVNAISDGHAEILISDPVALERMRMGIQISERDDGGIDIDSTQVKPSATKITSGSTIMVTQKSIIEQVMRISPLWSAGLILIAVAILFVTVFILKKFISLLFLIVSLVVSGVLALFLQSMVRPWVADIAGKVFSQDDMPAPGVIAFLLLFLVFFILSTFIVKFFRKTKASR